MRDPQSPALPSGPPPTETYFGATLPDPSIVLSPKDASVIGRPSVVVAPTGYGLVSYVAPIDGEFDVLATPVACERN